MTRRQRTEPTRYARKLRDADLVKTSPWAGNVPVLGSQRDLRLTAVDQDPSTAVK